MQPLVKNGSYCCFKLFLYACSPKFNSVWYPISTSGLDSTYNPTMSDSHSVPISSPIPRPGSYTGSPVPDSYVNQGLSRVSEDQPLGEYSFTSSATGSIETSKTITTVSNTSSQSSRSTEDELRDRIKQLEQELKQKDATIEQQKRQQSVSAPKIHQHTSPLHSSVTYSKQGSISSPHHTGPIHHSSFSGPIQVCVATLYGSSLSVGGYWGGPACLYKSTCTFNIAFIACAINNCTHTHTRTCTHACTCTHTHTHNVHTHTHTHTHTAPLLSPQHNAAVPLSLCCRLCPAHPHTPHLPPSVEWASQWPS